MEEIKDYKVRKTTSVIALWGFVFGFGFGFWSIGVWSGLLTDWENK